MLLLWILVLIVGVAWLAHRRVAPLTAMAVVAVYLLAMGGIAFAGQFCQNFAYLDGHIGELHSSGTIAYMDEAVAFNVVTGSVVLAIGMLGLLLKQDEES